jgi:hypothetical protein
MEKLSRPKDKAREGSSVRTNIPIDNTRKDTVRNQSTRSSTVPKRPRRTTTTTRTGSQTHTGKKDTPQAREERV